MTDHDQPDLEFLEFCVWLDDPDADPGAYRFDPALGWTPAQRPEPPPVTPAGKPRKARRPPLPPAQPPATNSPSRFLTLEEAGAMVRTSPETVRYWIWEGRLRAYKPGRSVLVREDELMSFVSSREQGQVRVEKAKRDHG